MVALQRLGISLRGLGDDSLVAAYVLDPRGRRTPSTRCAASCSATTPCACATWSAPARSSPSREVESTPPPPTPPRTSTPWRACAWRCAQVRQAGLNGLYRELEMELLPVLAEHGAHRASTSTPRRSGWSATTSPPAGDHRASGARARRRRLSISPAQSSSPSCFFEKLGYPPGKKTKTGFSTDAEVLEELAQDHELPRVILEHRELTKLKSTYIDALPRWSTARPAACTPLQPDRRRHRPPVELRSQPAEHPHPHRGRAGASARAFVRRARLGADLRRLLADRAARAGAPRRATRRFVDAFARGEDIHARTAARGLRPAAAGRRRDAAPRQGDQLRHPLRHVRLRPGARARHPARRGRRRTSRPTSRAIRAIRDFLDAHHRARRGGAATSAPCSAGARFLPELHSTNRDVRQGAERIAMNTPIQGTRRRPHQAGDAAVDRGASSAGARGPDAPAGPRRAGARGAGKGRARHVVELVRREMSGVMQLRYRSRWTSASASTGRWPTDAFRR